MKLRNHLLRKNCIDYAFFHCFLVKFTKIHGILSNFERKNRKKFMQLLRLRPFSGCLYKKSVISLTPLALLKGYSWGGGPSYIIRKMPGVRRLREGVFSDLFCLDQIYRGAGQSDRPSPHSLVRVKSHQRPSILRDSYNRILIQKRCKAPNVPIHRESHRKNDT